MLRASGVILFALFFGVTLNLCLSHATGVSDEIVVAAKTTPIEPIPRDALQIAVNTQRLAELERWRIQVESAKVEERIIRLEAVTETLLARFVEQYNIALSLGGIASVVAMAVCGLLFKVSREMGSLREIMKSYHHKNVTIE